MHSLNPTGQATIESKYPFVCSPFSALWTHVERLNENNEMSVSVSYTFWTKFGVTGMLAVTLGARLNAGVYGIHSDRSCRR